MKKCSECAKPAVFHVTEIEDGPPEEVHFCEEHFHAYMKGGGDGLGPQAVATGASGAAKTKAALKNVGSVAGKAADLRCPECGISFAEFREKGRFGCPGDYAVFREQLLPLIENIHDATRHAGKVPAGAGRGEDSRQHRLVRLRKDLAAAVEEEQYEEAARLRDAIGELGGVE